MPHFRFIHLFGFAVLAAFFAVSSAQAHHGWGWATDEEFEERMSGWLKRSDW